jgi:hypothetical protein
MVDLTTKFLLGIIALGLWANVAIVTVQFRPLTAIAEKTGQLGYLSPIHDHFSTIVRNIELIQTGQCRNSKLC